MVICAPVLMAVGTTMAASMASKALEKAPKEKAADAAANATQGPTQAKANAQDPSLFAGGSNYAGDLQVNKPIVSTLLEKLVESEAKVKHLELQMGIGSKQAGVNTQG
jgi:hypothetical protein